MAMAMKEKQKTKLGDFPLSMSAQELSKLWDIGYTQTKALLRALQDIGEPVGMKTLRGWKVNRDKAYAILGTKTMQRAYDKINGLEVEGIDY